MKIITLFAFAVAITMTPGLARVSLAGTKITCSVQALDPSAVPGEVTMYLESNRARIEFKNEDIYQAVIYTNAGNTPTLSFVDENAWTYREITRDDMGKVRGRAADELETIEEALREIPSDEREATRAQIRASMHSSGVVGYLPRLPFKGPTQPAKSRSTNNA